LLSGIWARLWTRRQNVICTASWAPASAHISLAHTPARCQRTKRLSQVVYGPKLSGRSRYGAPDRKTQKMPLRTRRSFTHSWHAARLIRQHRLDGRPLIVGEFVAHDSAPRFRGLESSSAGGLNMPGQGALWSRCAESGRVMLTLGFVVRDPKRSFTCLRSTYPKVPYRACPCGRN